MSINSHSGICRHLPIPADTRRLPPVAAEGANEQAVKGKS